MIRHFYLLIPLLFISCTETVTSPTTQEGGEPAGATVDPPIAGVQMAGDRLSGETSPVNDVGMADMSALDLAVSDLAVSDMMNPERDMLSEDMMVPPVADMEPATDMNPAVDMELMTDMAVIDMAVIDMAVIDMTVIDMDLSGLQIREACDVSSECAAGLSCLGWPTGNFCTPTCGYNPPASGLPSDPPCPEGYSLECHVSNQCLPARCSQGCDPGYICDESNRCAPQ